MYVFLYYLIYDLHCKEGSFIKLLFNYKTKFPFRQNNMSYDREYIVSMYSESVFRENVL